MSPSSAIRDRARRNHAQVLNLKACLHETRLAMGLSSADVADRMGSTPERVAELERYDADLTLKEMIRWLGALEVEWTIGAK